MKTLLLASLIGVWAMAAAAHSPLETSDPADGAVLDAAPAEVLFDFNGDIRLTRVTVNHDGSDLTDLDLSAYDGFVSEFAIPMPDSGPGTYLIEWRGLGTDGHVMTGTLSFTVT